METMPKLNRESAPDSLPPEITTSPETQDEDDMGGNEGGSLFEQIADQRNEKRDQFHPYTQTLTLNDIESCVRLEEATFPEHERCSREKVSLSSLHYTCRCDTDVAAVTSRWYAVHSPALSKPAARRITPILNTA